MQYLKSFIFSAFMIISTVIVASIALILFLLPFKHRFAVIRTFAVMNVFLLKHLCGLDYQIEGQENIPEGAGIIFSKHQSTWETMALQLIFPPQTFVLKRELMWVPFFGWGLAVMKPIAIDRGAGHNAIKQIVRQGIDRLKAGIWIVIFPEGTRVRPGQHIRYKMGGAILAAESGYPVVPVALNSGEFWPKKQFLKNPGTIKVVIGPSIQTRDRKPDAILAEAENWIETTMAQISTPPAAKP
jgi:1-acyl-sn-glycerol-3-phosphate acyltransferase